MFENSNVGSDHQQLTMQLMQSTARKYGLVCLLHEKPFAGVNGSGKHNNWSMGTDTGRNLMEPGDTPAENMSFLFFCAAVIQAVNKHQGLLRASVAAIGQDHRLGANEAPPAIISIFLGAELEKVFETIAAGEGDPHTPGSFDGRWARRCCPHAADARRRPQPHLAVRLHRQQVRVPRAGVQHVAGVPQQRAEHDRRRGHRRPGGQARGKVGGGDLGADGHARWSRRAYSANKQICFGGDNYTEEWHAEAEKRGLKNLRTTPDALPEVLAEPTVAAFEKYGVLSKRELESRFEVWVEQYATRANIEAETTSSMARTMLLPAALRHLALVDAAGMDALATETRGLVDEFAAAIGELETANVYPDDVEGMDLAIYARDHQMTAMAKVRELGDRLEKVVADDLWPLPKYEEMLFIK